MTMPEAAMNEYYLAPTWKYDIWITRKTFPMKPIPIPSREKELSYSKFWGSVTLFYLLHAE